MTFLSVLFLTAVAGILTASWWIDRGIREAEADVEFVEACWYWDAIRQVTA